MSSFFFIVPNLVPSSILSIFMPVMVSFKAVLKKFAEHGEKTGWTYLQVPASVAEKLLPGNRQSFRVKGKLDHYEINLVALVPMGEGNFIMAVNATMRKALKKQKGDEVKVQLEVDYSELKPPEDLIECLKDEPIALENFKGLPGSHRNYFTRWIGSAKTDQTRARRIAQAVSGLAQGRNFAEVMRAIKKQKQDLLR
jgi:hypothetical protein